MLNEREVGLLYFAYVLLNSRQFISGAVSQDLASRATTAASLACRSVAESSGYGYMDLPRQVTMLAAADKYTKIIGEFEVDITTALA